MRNWFVLFLVGALLLLPFSGSSSAMPMKNTNNEMNHHAAVLDTHEHFSQPDSQITEAEEAVGPHCESEKPKSANHHSASMKVADNGNKQGHSAHSESVEATESTESMESMESTESAAISSESASNELAQCCDDVSECGTKCPADCGHCVMFGHGCSAVLSNLNLRTPILSFSPAIIAPSFYSLLTSKPTPPPIIS